jgi:hypothetical protein
MPTLFTLPTATEVKDEAGLRPEQVQSLMTADAYTADVTARIASAGSRVEMALLTAAQPGAWPQSEEEWGIAYPSYSEDQIADALERQDAVAEEVAKLFALHSLYARAGQLNDAYEEKAADYERRAKELLAELVAAVTWIRDRQGTEVSTDTFSIAPQREDGYSQYADLIASYG